LHAVLVDIHVDFWPESPQKLLPSKTNNSNFAIHILSILYETKI
jgi:hypothetical protein